MKKFILAIFLSIPPIVSAQNFDDIAPHSPLKTEIDWAIRNDIFSPKSETEFGLREAITKAEFEKALTVLRCSSQNPYTLKSMEGRPENQHVKKSEFTRELSLVITANRPKKTDGSINVPSGWEKIAWQDIKPYQEHYQAAQILSALGVIDYNQGYFGYAAQTQKDLADPDPGVLREQMLLWLGRSFHLGQCGFIVLIDRDHDGVENEADLCPEIPGNTEKNGCPKIYRVPVSKKSDEKFVFLPRPGLDTNNLKFWSGTEIKVGDIFFAAVVHPITKEIISRSIRHTVTE